MPYDWKFIRDTFFFVMHALLSMLFLHSRNKCIKISTIALFYLALKNVQYNSSNKIN